MYVAKETGRNRTALAGQPVPAPHADHPLALTALTRSKAAGV